MTIINDDSQKNFDEEIHDQLDGEGNDDKFVPPKDGSWVPRSRMNEAVDKVRGELMSEREARIRLEEKVNQLSETKSKEAETAYTPAQLRAFVEDGRISQEQADSIYQKQQQQEIDRRIAKAVQESTARNEETRSVTMKLEAYKGLIPDLMSDGSQSRAKVAQHYRRLVATFGQQQPDSIGDQRIQLAACEAAFGTVEDIQRRKSLDMTSESRETHQDSGSDSDSGVAESKVARRLDARQRSYYQRMIDNGFYKDWKEVEAELKYAKR